MQHITALITCNMSCATCYKGTAQQIPTVICHKQVQVHTDRYPQSSVTNRYRYTPADTHSHLSQTGDRYTPADTHSHLSQTGTGTHRQIPTVICHKQVTGTHRQIPTVICHKQVQVHTGRYPQSSVTNRYRYRYTPADIHCHLSQTGDRYTPADTHSHLSQRDDRYSSAIKFGRVEITFILALFYWLKQLIDEGWEETRVPEENPNDQLRTTHQVSLAVWPDDCRAIAAVTQSHRGRR